MTAPFHQRLLAMLGLCLLMGIQLASAGALPSAATKASNQDVSAAQTETSKALTLEERIARALQKIEETRGEISAAETVSEAALPSGIGMADLQERQDLLRWLMTWYTGELSGLETLKDLQRSRAALQTEMQSWQGFTEQPPYSVGLLEQLWGEVHTKTRELEAATLSQRAMETMAKESRNSLKGSEQLLRQANERVEQARDADEKAREQWRRDQGFYPVITDG